MKVFTNKQFEGNYPVGTAAVVVADSAKDGAEILNSNLSLIGLKESAKEEDMIEISTERESCRILCDGEY